IGAQDVAHHDIGRAGLIEAGHYVRPDKSGPAGYQEHSYPRHYRLRGKPLPQPGVRRNLRLIGSASGWEQGKKSAAGQRPLPRVTAANGSKWGTDWRRESMKEDVKQVAAPVVIIPYVWIGDFVRCHSVVKLLRAKSPDRPIDIVSSTLCG